MAGQRVLALLILVYAMAAAQAAGGAATDQHKQDALINGQPASVLIDRLVSWLRANGARFDKVQPTWSRQGGFTIRVTKAVAEGECLVQAPLKVLLGPKAVEASWLRSLLAPLPVPEQVQVLLMWEDANSTSFFRPYLDMLPQTFDTPLFWTREQAKELQGTQLLERSITLRHEMPRSYQHLKMTILDKHPGLFPPERFSYERYLWSYSVVRSRAFGNFTLMPLIDLMNHHPHSRLAPTLMADGTGDRLLARSELGAGEEVWGFYGHKSDSDLVGSYGFTCAPLVENPFNSVELLVDMDLDRPSTSALAGMKHVLLRSLGLASSPQSFVIFKGAIPPTLMTFLTMDACDDEHGEAVLAAAAAAAIASVPAYWAQDILRRAYGRLQRLCEQRVARYGSTLVDDLLLLSRADPHSQHPRRRLALMLRMGEKDVLESLAAAAAAAQAALGGPHVEEQLVWSLARGDMAPLLASKPAALAS